jgi:hypothetical protein
VRWLFRVALGAVLGLAAPAAYGQQDPRLRWRTLETPHFRVHFYQEMEPVARRVARVSEALVERLAGPLGWRQSQRTEVVLSDDTDDANGSATSLPFNTVRLYLTAPDDLSVLHQYDDWLVNLMTHEYTHILHTDNISGIPALVNAIIGKQWSPNQVQPRFILEGLAVFEETLHTRGGRLRSSMWDMYLRGDALAGSLLTLDQLCNGPNRWPHGNLWYLYGSYLMQFVADRYGADRLAALSREYGSMTVPWQLNRAARRTIGHGWEELYDAWRADTVTRYQRQRDAITAEGLVEGAALTAQGEHVRNPRFLPDGTLLYESADGRSQQQLRSLPPSALAAGAPRAEPRSLAWTGNASGFAVVDADTLVVSDVAPYRHVHFYHDLHRWSLRRGDDGAVSLAERARLSQGWRAQQPDVSPDGDHVAYTVNHRGTTALFEMSLTERTPRAVFRPRRYEQVYAPRYAPDGRTVAFFLVASGGPSRHRSVASRDGRGRARHRRRRPRSLPRVEPRRALSPVVERSYRRVQRVRARGGDGAHVAGDQRAGRGLPACGESRRKHPGVRGIQRPRLRPAPPRLSPRGVARAPGAAARSARPRRPFPAHRR